MLADMPQFSTFSANNTFDGIFSDFQCLSGSNAGFCARCGSANRVFSAREWGLAEEAGKVWKIAMDCEDCHQNHQIMGIMVKPWILGQALQEAPTAQGDTSEMSNVWRTISIDCRLVDVASLQV